MGLVDDGFWVFVLWFVVSVVFVVFGIWVAVVAL